MSSPELKNFRRIVIKVGSSLLIDSTAGEVRAKWLAALAADIAKLHADGRDVLVVSSGSIALGRSRLKLPRGPLKLEESQAAAAVGQIALARIWSEVLGHHGIGAGQMSRVDAARIAALKARDAAKKAGLAEPMTVGSVASSDAFFPFPDGLLAVAEAGATAVIQPGGSLNDAAVIAAADEAGIAMVFSGVRQFRH